jgi:hypothetical protein
VWDLFTYNHRGPGAGYAPGPSNASLGQVSTLPQFRKRPVTVQADQWFRNGDHPDDNVRWVNTDDGPIPFLSEGEIVRYYRTPGLDGQTCCRRCGVIMHDHGWIDTLEGGHIVCPGDWIITGTAGERYPVKPAIFAETYEPV